MAITFDRLKELLKGEGLKFFIDPERPVARLGFMGMFARLEIALALQDDGNFLQLRTISYLTCLDSHEHKAAVLQVLAAINFQKRLVKFGWDSSDGEIAAYADLWIMDNQVTQQQFHRMMGNFIPAIDQAHPRLQETLQTGKDPGEKDLAAAATTTPGGTPPGALPPELKEVLEKLARRGGGTDPKPGGEAISAI